MITLQFDSRLFTVKFPEHIPVENISHHVVLCHLPAGKSLNQILEDLNAPLAQAVVAIVNGQTADLDEILKPGDEVRLLPQIAGGD